MKNLFLLVIFFTISSTVFCQNSNNETLRKVIERMADSVIGDRGNLQFVIKDRLLVCITDENHNRMRIITPVTEVSNLTGDELLNALVANFHTALDVKYAISDEILWSVFIHPLNELSEAQIEDAISQVYFAAETFGSSYSSSTLVFPNKVSEKEPPIEKVKTARLQKG